MGAWEREHIGKPVAETAAAAKLITSGALVIGAGGIALAAYGLYYFFDKVYDAFEDLPSKVSESGYMYKSPTLALYEFFFGSPDAKPGPEKPHDAPPTGTYDEYGIWGGQVGPPDNRPR